MKTKEIAEFLSAELVGDSDIEITGVASLDAASIGFISFSTETNAFETSASAVIVSKAFEARSSLTLIKAADPKLAFTRISRVLRPPKLAKSWHGTAYVPTNSHVQASLVGAHVSVGEGTKIGENSQLHAGVRIGENVTIGESTIIHPNCTIYDGVTIGSHCVIHAGTVLGSDGFGYVKDEDGEHIQFPQIGSLVIENRVEIGANCCIDRGSLGETRIGAGTKLDNMVQIAHNVRIGKRVLIASQTGIAGSSVVEDDVVMAGQVGIGDHVTIRSGAIIGGKSGIFPKKILRAGFWMGIPAQRIDEYMKQSLLVRGLEKLKEEVKELKKSKS